MEGCDITTKAHPPAKKRGGDLRRKPPPHPKNLVGRDITTKEHPLKHF